jgi:hypothetical protein
MRDPLKRLKGQYLKEEPKKKTPPVKGDHTTAKIHLSFLSGSGKICRHGGAQ